MKIAYFDCYSGISGDMILGAFLDAGLDIEVLSSELKKLNIKGYSIKSAKTKRGGITGTKFDCVSHKSGHPHRSLKEIITLIEKSSLSEKIKNNAKNIFLAIGKVEAGIHGYGSLNDVHLHELGDIDSIIDIVGAAIALDALEIDQIHSSPLSLARGVVNTKAGRLPLPSPASLELIKGMPVKMLDMEGELVTPTGAGVLKALARGFGAMPGMKISSVGYGAGTKDFKNIPNMLRVIIGERAASFKEDNIVVVETNIDDMNPQNFEYLFERLFKEGALDVYTSVINMKKSRTAFKLTVLAYPADLNKVRDTIFSESTTIGIRYYEAARFKLDREMRKVSTRYGSVNVKLSTGPGDILTAMPEYEECVALARKAKVPLKTVHDEAKRAVRI